MDKTDTTASSSPADADENTIFSAAQRLSTVSNSRTDAGFPTDETPPISRNTSLASMSPRLSRQPSGSQRGRSRAKSCDISNIVSKLAVKDTRYYHKDCWTDDEGNVFRGKNPNLKADEEAKLDEPAGAEKKKKSRTKKILFLEIKLKRISAIDTTKETFRCRFHYYLTWLASYEEYMSFQSDRDQYVPEWIPKIELVNAAEVHENFRGSNYTIKSRKSVGFNDEWRIHEKYLGFDGRDGKWNRVRFEADVTFAEELELEAFPFDCQDLSIYMKVEKDCIDSCDIVAFPREGDFCLLDPQFSVLSEWYLENLVTEFGFTDPLKSKSLRCYSIVSVHIKASRRWETHVGMIIVTFCMFSLGLGTFSQGVGADQLGERLGFCVTFLLADVATMQFMFGHLPLIPYWTILDFYIYSSFIFLFLITIWSCLAGAIDRFDEIDIDVDGQGSDGRDSIAFWVFTSIHILLHIGYVSFSIYYRTRERSKLNMTSAELEAYFDGERSMADRRAISNTWDQQNLIDQHENCDGDDLTTFHFQGSKLEPLRRSTKFSRKKILRKPFIE